MDIEKVLLDKIKRFEDVKNNIDRLNAQIGGLTEQRLALYNMGLEIKGSIEALQELKRQEAEALAGSKTAGLTLPAGVKPVIPDAPVAQEPTPQAVSPAIPEKKVELEVK